MGSFLSALEFRVLEVLSNHDGLIARDVTMLLEKQRSGYYNSHSLMKVASVLTGLCRRGFVVRTQNSRHHRYCLATSLDEILESQNSSKPTDRQVYVVKCFVEKMREKL